MCCKVQEAKIEPYFSVITEGTKIWGNCNFSNARSKLVVLSVAVFGEGFSSTLACPRFWGGYSAFRANADVAGFGYFNGVAVGRYGFGYNVGFYLQRIKVFGLIGWIGLNIAFATALFECVFANYFFFTGGKISTCVGCIAVTVSGATYFVAAGFFDDF